MICDYIIHHYILKYVHYDKWVCIIIFQYSNWWYSNQFLSIVATDGLETWRLPRGTTFLYGTPSLLVRLF